MANHQIVDSDVAAKVRTVIGALEAAASDGNATTVALYSGMLVSLVEQLLPFAPFVGSVEAKEQRAFVATGDSQ